MCFPAPVQKEDRKKSDPFALLLWPPSWAGPLSAGPYPQLSGNVDAVLKRRQSKAGRTPRLLLLLLLLLNTPDVFTFPALLVLLEERSHQ